MDSFPTPPLVPGTAPKRPLTYLASPYTHPSQEVIERRVAAVTRATVWLIKNNEWNVFSPIIHSHPLAAKGLKGDWETWKRIDEEYLSVSERMVVLELPGWQNSTGVKAEIEIARRLGVPIYYMRPDPIREDSEDYNIQSIPFSRVGSEPRAGIHSLLGAPKPYKAEELEKIRITCASNESRCVTAEQERRELGQPKKEDDGTLRKFATGATRDTAEGKFDYEGFLVPEVLEAFGEYMHKHRKQTDGSFRDSDNWQKGIPRRVYIKSAWRHFLQLWKLHRGREARDEKGNVVTITDACCALMFNVMGYLFEYQEGR